ncbi:pyridoxal-phosphate dependent enzyme [Rubricoccus marinus]|uniref:Cystathionine beta-synthase n=1 Tax=Rubricoccus marinus TaxID=716817 RepID=A0A259TY90_9BACT|nr:pyridoxal-phosphate dependent enzyme [Rubricoccus marinus]OZC02719.1 cystathionine beta-synthase [Rubricoccus marinus]
MWHDSILDTIGNTPLVRLNALASDLPCTVLAKVEFFNPGASVKDRIGLAMVDDAERKGLLKPGGTIIEGTSGNTGFGLALVAIARGYSCIFTTTDKQSQAKIDSLRALGAEVIVCPTAVAPEDPRSYYSVAKRLSEEIPNSFYPNQYDHPANAQAHYDSTGPELWEQTEGRITHFIAGAGTGGTISGTTRYLKEQNPAVKSIGVDPYGSVYYKYFHSGGEFDEAEIFPYLTEGVGEDILAGNMDFSLLDDYVRVTDKEAMQMTRRLAKEEGLFVGQSCGMAMAGALDWMRDHAGELTPEDVVVVLLPDNGFRYLAKTFNDDWMRQHGFLEAPRALTAGDVLVSRPGGVFSVSPQATLADAVEVMNEHGISQLPVYDGETLVGSLNERGILARLVADPEARQERVEAVMGEPFPVVEADVSVAGLSAHLENGMGAVLVRATTSGEAHILTRSDLIAALAQQTS